MTTTRVSFDGRRALLTRGLAATAGGAGLARAGGCATPPPADLRPPEVALADLRRLGRLLNMP